MTFEIALMLGLVLATLVVFFKEWLPIEVTALALLAVLMVTGLVPVSEALAGFSNKAVIAIGGLFVLSHALVKTGALELATDLLARRAGRRSWRRIGVLLVAVAVLSGFLNNTAIVAIFIPLVVDLCRRMELAPSKVLIPISYASIFGGTLTLIGTSTNLLVSSIAEEAGEPAFGMFEFTPLGVVFLGVGLTYLYFLAPKMLPEHAADADLTEKYRLDGYLAEVRVRKASDMVGRKLTELEISKRYGITVVAIIRGGERLIEGIQHVPLAAQDRLIVEGSAADLLRMVEERTLEPLPETEYHDPELAEGGLVVVEAVVTYTSRVVGEPISSIDFRELYGGFLLAVRRVEGTIRERLARTKLRAADTVLMLLPAERLDEVARGDDFLLLTEVDLKLQRARLWWLAPVLLPVVVALAGFGVLEISAGVLVGSVVLLATRVLSPREAYRAIDWSVIFLIAAFVPVGYAFVKTGTAAYLSSGLLAATQLVPPELAPWAAVALLYLVTSLTTQMVSNAAAAIILAPIALGAAETLGVDSRPLLMAVCFAASAEFMTPMGYQTNMMVYGPGNYRFLDYTKFGAPLNLLFWAMATLLIPRIWPF